MFSSQLRRGHLGRGLHLLVGKYYQHDIIDCKPLRDGTELTRVGFRHISTLPPVFTPDSPPPPSDTIRKPTFDDALEEIQAQPGAGVLPVSPAISFQQLHLEATRGSVSISLHGGHLQTPQFDRGETA